MAKPFHEGDLRSQIGTHQTATLDDRRQRRPPRFAALVAPVFRTGMLLDRQRRGLNIHLLYDPLQGTVAPQDAATIRTNLEFVPAKAADLLRGKWLAFLFGVTGLTADRPRRICCLRTARFRFDDIRRWGFRRG